MLSMNINGGLIMSDLYGEQYLSEEMEDFIDAFDMNDRACTCYDCEDRMLCQYAYDPYNSNGDCLAVK